MFTSVRVKSLDNKKKIPRDWLLLTRCVSYSRKIKFLILFIYA